MSVQTRTRTPTSAARQKVGVPASTSPKYLLLPTSQRRRLFLQAASGVRSAMPAGSFSASSMVSNPTDSCFTGRAVVERMPLICLADNLLTADAAGLWISCRQSCTIGAQEITGCFSCQTCSLQARTLQRTVRKHRTRLGTESLLLTLVDWGSWPAATRHSV